MRHRSTMLLLSLLIPPALAAQGHEHGPAPKIVNGGVFPAGWSVRLDEDGKPTDVSLVSMAPGWHITTAASGIMYRAADTASGTYTLNTKIHLFPSQGGHAEAFGLFIGGRDLAGPGQRYTYFLIRGDGSYKVKRRDGSKAADVTKDWTPSPAIVQAKADGPVANVLTVQVGKDKVSFSVNGQEIYSAPTASLDASGNFGLRVNHNLSLHVETLELKR
ncbi:MAG TPA: hypothetical protein VEI47_03240 [Gemmatimonadales bacterium]|nr:hypothetical protein [Gemmatimonadales bacterium]